MLASMDEVLPLAVGVFATFCLTDVGSFAASAMVAATGGFPARRLLRVVAEGGVGALGVVPADTVAP